MNKYMPVRAAWDFEANYCRNPQVWVVQALNLRGNLEALILYDQEVFDCVFKRKVEPRLKAFWSAGVERMLMGFSLENLAKGLIFLDSKKADRAFSKKGNLRWCVPSHDLAKLLKEGKFDFSDEEFMFLSLWTTSSTWAGRYPLPMNENHLPRQRMPATNSEELLQRRMREIQKAADAGTALPIEQTDLLYCSVGPYEIAIYRQLFDRLRAEIERPRTTGCRLSHASGNAMPL